MRATRRAARYGERIACPRRWACSRRRAPFRRRRASTARRRCRSASRSSPARRQAARCGNLVVGGGPPFDPHRQGSRYHGALKPRARRFNPRSFSRALDASAAAAHLSETAWPPSIPTSCPGVKIMMENAPVSIVERVRQARQGQAFNRVKYRNLLNGRVNEKNIAPATPSKRRRGRDRHAYLFKDGEGGTSWTRHYSSTWSPRPAWATHKWIKSGRLRRDAVEQPADLECRRRTSSTSRWPTPIPACAATPARAAPSRRPFETGAVVRVPLFINIGRC